MPAKLTFAALAALLAKVLPKFLFNRALYKMTGRKAIMLGSALVMLGLTIWLSPATAASNDNQNPLERFIAQPSSAISDEPRGYVLEDYLYCARAKQVTNVKVDSYAE